MAKNLTKQELEEKAAAYFALDKQMRAMKKEHDAIKEDLREAVVQKGSEDDKGSKILELAQYILKNEARVSVGLDYDAAEAFLRKQGLWKKCVITKEVLDETKLAEVYEKGSISPKEMEAMTSRSTSFAFKIAPKE